MEFCGGKGTLMVELRGGNGARPTPDCDISHQNALNHGNSNLGISRKRLCRSNTTTSSSQETSSSSIRGFRPNQRMDNWLCALVTSHSRPIQPRFFLVSFHRPQSLHPFPSAITNPRRCRRSKRWLFAN